MRKQHRSTERRGDRGEELGREGPWTRQEDVGTMVVGIEGIMGVGRGGMVVEVKWAGGANERRGGGPDAERD